MSGNDEFDLNYRPDYGRNTKTGEWLTTVCCNCGFHYDRKKQVHVCGKCGRWLCASDCCLRLEKINGNAD